MFEDKLGARSTPVRNTVERGAVRRFADAVGDPSPLYRDEDAAARSRWGRLLAPPTFPRTFDFGRIDGVELPPAGVIHGEQTYHYRRPLLVGEELLCHTELVDSYAKPGGNGLLTFVVFRRVAVDAEGREVMSSDEVYILTEAVLETEDAP